MKREIYTIAGRDYEKYEIVNFTINVPINSIQTIIDKLHEYRIIYKIGKAYSASISQYYSEKCKSIVITAYAENLVNFFHHVIHVPFRNELRNNFDIRNSEFRKFRNKAQKMNYILFNSLTKEIKLTATTPFPVGSQITRGSGQTKHFIAKRI